MCLFPQNAQLNELGLLQFTHEGNLKIPCGKCQECVTKRSQEWALRCKHEISLHRDNCFLNLTYNPENVPSISLIKNEFQKFIKRLRKKTKLSIRYIVSHEYGTKNLRPHHHAIIFGWSPSDQKFHKNSPGSGEPLFRSNELEKLWTAGHALIGSANEKSAYYIASYSLKGKKHKLTDPITGEIVTISDSMDCSKRPAIGYNYFVQNYIQLIDSDSILPRYYFKKLQALNPTLHEHYENKRSTLFKTRSSHELLATFVIKKQKSNIRSGEFREVEDDILKEDANLKKQLEQQRDDYHHVTLSKDKK